MWIDLVILALAGITAFIVITLLYHFLTPVPFVPTPAHIIDAMIGLIPWKGHEVVYDLGAGDGRILEAIKRLHPSVTVRGCEFVPSIWILARLRALVRKSGVRVALQSMRTVDVSRADVVVLYLFPALMGELAEKFDRELRPGAYVVTQTFGFPTKNPLKEVRVPRFGGEVSVFLYRW